MCSSYRNVFNSISSDSLGGIAAAYTATYVSFFLEHLQLPAASSLSILSSESFPILYCCFVNCEHFPAASYRYLVIIPLSVSALESYDNWCTVAGLSVNGGGMQSSASFFMGFFKCIVSRLPLNILLLSDRHTNGSQARLCDRLLNRSSVPPAPAGRAAATAATPVNYGTFYTKLNGGTNVLFYYYGYGYYYSCLFSPYLI